MSDILGIALSGAAAATRRIDATASKLANQRTTGRLPDSKAVASADSRAPYTPLTTSQSDLRTPTGKGPAPRRRSSHCRSLSSRNTTRPHPTPMRKA